LDSDIHLLTVWPLRASVVPQGAHSCVREQYIHLWVLAWTGRTHQINVMTVVQRRGKEAENNVNDVLGEALLHAPYQWKLLGERRDTRCTLLHRDLAQTAATGKTVLTAKIVDSSVFVSKRNQAL